MIATILARSFRIGNAAREIATRYAADSLRDLDGDLRPDDEWRLEMQMEDGARVFQILIRASQG
ncbi:DUF6894 family protein [Bradyrhizobium sp. CCBAU 51627]|uniref:DUF6894 family protein n=1 Tax=Bradyrhizobium sp. CCBAU 51627 TaxID=1325088 RepID=UPI00230636D1|nr:hypothetical protein [Bradyrhizobium sp. CCBAU 51627]MDA9430720.1 hypothetical protein [Bradyrhizobium sp. CCBAU 51627]